MTTGFNYKTFRELIVDNPLRSNCFKFFLENKTLLEGYIDNNNFGGVASPFDDVDILTEFFTSGVQMPNRFSGLINANFQGMQIKFSGEATVYDPLILIIQENGSLDAYKFFHDWFNKVQNDKSGLIPVTTRLLPSLDEFNGLLVLLSDNVVTVIKFHGLFPLLLGSYSLAWQSSEIVTYPIHLAFDYLEIYGPFKPEDDEYTYYKDLSTKDL